LSAAPYFIYNKGTKASVTFLQKSVMVGWKSTNALQGIDVSRKYALSPSRKVRQFQ